MLDASTGRRPEPPRRPPIRISEVLRAVAVLGFGGYIFYTGLVMYSSTRLISSPIGYQGRLAWGTIAVLYGVFRLYQVLAVNFRKNRFDDDLD